MAYSAPTSWTDHGMVWTAAHMSGYDYVPVSYLHALILACRERQQAMDDINGAAVGYPALPEPNDYIRFFDPVAFVLDGLIKPARAYLHAAVDYRTPPSDGDSVITQWTEASMLAKIGESRVSSGIDSYPTWKLYLQGYKLLNEIKWFFEALSVYGDLGKRGSNNYPDAFSYANAIADIKAEYDADDPPSYSAKNPGIRQESVIACTDYPRHGDVYYGHQLTIPGQLGAAAAHKNETDFERQVDIFLVAHAPQDGSFDSTVFDSQGNGYNEDALSLISSGTTVPSGATHPDVDIISSYPRPDNFASAPPTEESHRRGWICYDRETPGNPLDPEDLQAAYAIHKYDGSNGFKFLT